MDLMDVGVTVVVRMINLADQDPALSPGTLSLYRRSDGLTKVTRAPVRRNTLMKEIQGVALVFVKVATQAPEKGVGILQCEVNVNFFTAISVLLTEIATGTLTTGEITIHTMSINVGSTMVIGEKSPFVIRVIINQATRLHLTSTPRATTPRVVSTHRRVCHLAASMCRAVGRLVSSTHHGEGGDYHRDLHEDHPTIILLRNHRIVMAKTLTTSTEGIEMMMI